jgi:hypothetical protein
MAINVSGGGFRFSVAAYGGEWSWLVAVNNIPNAGQSTQIKDIQSPFGPFTMANIPLPGDVVLAMAGSLSEFQQQLAPEISLISPSSLAFTVTEGDPILNAASIVFQNIGALGSYMIGYAVPDVPWMTSNPSSVVGLGKNQQGQSAIQVIPAPLLASLSPYTGHINMQDNANPPDVIPVTFTITVLPRPTIGLSVSQVDLTFDMPTSTPSAPVDMVVTNTGPLTSTLNFVLAKVLNSSPWLSIIPMSGGPLGSGDNVHVVFSVVNTFVPAVPGVYTDTIRVSSSNATNSPIDLPVTMTVIP